MLIRFGFLDFEIKGNKVFLLGPDGDANDAEYLHFGEVSVVGEDKPFHYGKKAICSTENGQLRYVFHEQTDERLRIVQESSLIRLESVFERFDDSSTIRAYSRVTNICDKEIVLEDVASLCVPKIVDNRVCEREQLYFYTFFQGHHAECQIRRQSFDELGLFRTTSDSQKSICYSNVGSWSTKERLPQGIIEDTKNKRFVMFQIESNHSWHYEVSDVRGNFYLYLTGASASSCGWSKTLSPSESYQTSRVALAIGVSIDGVVGDMTTFRRHIKGECVADLEQPSIFNEYMHLSWDSPTESKTREIAPAVAKTGVEYYVIDCGWHNEEPGDKIYPYVGQWKESKTRFPNGVRKTTDFIRSLGMKAGLWIEPEIVGKECREMLAYYDDDCFLTRYGRKVCVNGRYFLDFRHAKVVGYLTNTIERMVEEYGAQYIKLDYNQDVGVGTDKYEKNQIEGLEESVDAYFSWVSSVKRKYPNVLFETCSSGGMRMDYRTLGEFSIVSTSDQTSYLNYPYIAGNVLSAVLPEQAAVWSYPVDSFGEVNADFSPTKEWVNQNIPAEQIVMNMINSFLGRMHLASHLELLSEEKFALVQEGVAYYKKLSKIRNQAVPIFPKGFTRFGEDGVVCGLRDGKKIYLAVWNLGKKKQVKIPLDYPITTAKLGYPSFATTPFRLENQQLIVDFEEEKMARFFELEE